MAQQGVQDTDHVKGLLQGGNQGQKSKEQRQQSMAGYAAELQAQIAEKERRKRLQRQNSLRESQDLLAQRMTVPSGLLEGVSSQQSRSVPTYQPPRALQQPAPPQQAARSSYDADTQYPASQYGRREPYRPVSAAQGAPNSTPRPQAAHQDSALYQQQSSADGMSPSAWGSAPSGNQQRPDQRPDYGRDSMDRGSQQRPDQRSDYGRDSDHGRDSMNRGYGRDSINRGYGDNQSFNTDRPAASSPSRDLGSSNLQTLSPPSSQAAEAKKAAYRAELEAQMKSREEAKKKERADRLQEDLRVHREAAKYDPWGKAGGGAPQSPCGSPSHPERQRPEMPAQSQNAAPLQRPGESYSSYEQYSRQAPPQGASYPQPQASDSSRQGQQFGQQGTTAPYRQPEPYSSRQDLPEQQSMGSGSYRQPQGSQQPFDPYSSRPQGVPSNAPGGQSGAGVSGSYGVGGLQDTRRGPTPASSQAQASLGTGAASVMALGQNKIPQRAEVYFRSDKINMRPEEIAAKQEQASQLQDELKRQIEEKRRIKEEQQRREKEEDAREQARLQAEQEKLNQQFAEEKEAEKAKKAAESGADQQVQQAWAQAKRKEPLNRRTSNLASSSSSVGQQLQRQPSNHRPPSSRRPSNLSANNVDRQEGRRDRQDGAPDSLHADNNSRDGGNASAGASGLRGFGQMQGQFGAGHSATALSQSGINGPQMPWPGQALGGLTEASNGSAMLAARQAAAAQLEQFRAEMMAEAAKMRAAVERQQVEVAELNRRAQHAEQESTAARAEAAAVRQAAAQQQAERAIAQYTQAQRLNALPFQEAQLAREYEPLTSLGGSRPRSSAPYLGGNEAQLPSGLAMWSATNPGDYGASLRGSAVFRRPLTSDSSAMDRGEVGLGSGWHPAQDSGLGESMAAESTLIYPKARPPAAPASLRQSVASHRPAGAPAAEASGPAEEDDGDQELQAEAIAVPLRDQGGAATPVADMGLLFARNQSKLRALKMLEEQAASGNAEALDDFLQKYAATSSYQSRSQDQIPAQHGEQESFVPPGERSITSSSRWMNTF